MAIRKSNRLGGGGFFTNIVDVLLNKIDIVDLISQYTELRQSSKGYLGKCPLHNGDGQSTIWVTENPAIFYCFSCGKTGNAIHFYMEIENIDYNTAVEQIAEANNVDIGKNEDWKRQKTHTEKCNNLMRKYQSRLDKCIDYLKNERALTEATISEFKLGWTPDISEDNVSFSKPEKYTGLSGIAIPLHDKNGRVVAFSYRTFSQPKYINSMNNDLYIKSDYLYNADKAKRLIKDRLYVVEGYFDVMAAHQQGLPCVAYAGSMLSKGHIQGIKEMCARRENVSLYLAPDNDQAGQDNIERMRERLKLLNIATRVVEIG